MKRKRTLEAEGDKQSKLSSTKQSLKDPESASLPPTEVQNDHEGFDMDDNDSLADGGTEEDSFEHQFSDSLADVIDGFVEKEQQGRLETETLVSDTFGTIVRRHVGRPVCGSCRVKKKIATAWSSKHSKSKERIHFPIPGEPEGLPFSTLQAELFPWIASYQDLLFTDRQDSWSQDMREVLALHALNHVLKTRDRIISNTSKLNAAAASGKELDLDLRDQTFVRPKVLVLLPFRSAAYAFVKTLMAYSGSMQQENKSRFEDEYGDGGETKRLDPTKPAEFHKLFERNSDDNFRLGLKLTRKSVKLFSDFFSSDIIVASPLGLRSISEKNHNKDELGDVLSSIEIIILDQCDVFLMQNWEHVQHVFSKLNNIPKNSHGCDFSRLMRWSLDGKSRYLRQTIVFSSINSPDINALVKKNCHNITGNLRTTRSYPGVERDAPGLIPQIFRRFECLRPAEEADLRFNFFTETILPSLRVTPSAGVLIFVSSYFEFVRLRNYFIKNDINFASLSEYTDPADANRNRALFSSGEHPIILVTERVHFFRRYRIKGCKKILFYSLPDYPVFYTDFLKLALPEAGGTSTSIFCRLDRLKLERIVGTTRAADWMSQQKTSFT